MSTQMQVKFNLLIEETGLYAGIGAGEVARAVLSAANLALKGAINLYPATADPTVFQLPEPERKEIFEMLAVTSQLLQSPLVEEVDLRIDSPTEQQVDAILSGIKWCANYAKLRTLWHSDRIKDSFSTNGTRWVDSVDHLLESSYERILPKTTGVRFFHATGLEAIFNPMVRQNTLRVVAAGRHPEYREFIRKIGCLPSYMSLETRAMKQY